MHPYNFTRTSRGSLPHPRLGSRCLTIAATLKSVLLAERTQSYRGTSAAETQVPPKVQKGRRRENQPPRRRPATSQYDGEARQQPVSQLPCRRKEKGNSSISRFAQMAQREQSGIACLLWWCQLCQQLPDSYSLMDCKWKLTSLINIARK